MKRFLMSIFICVLGTPLLSQEGDAVDSLIRLLNAHHQRDTVRMYLLSDLAGETTGDNSISFCTEGIELANFLAEKEKSIQLQKILKKNAALFYERIGDCYYEVGEFIKTFENYEKSYEINKEIGDKKGMASMLSNISLIYTYQGNIEKALKNYGVVIKIFEEIGYKEGVANTLNNVGYINDQIGENQKGLDYYLKAADAWKKTKGMKGLATTYNNVGQQFSEMKQYDTALFYFNESLKLYSGTNNDKGLATCYANMAILFENTGDRKKALEYHYKSLEIREKIGEKSNISNSYANIATILEREGETKKALEYGLKSMKLAREVGFPANIKTAAVVLNIIYRRQKKFEKALEMYELSIVMRDSLSNQQNRKEALKQQFKYEYEKKLAADSVKQVTQLKIEEAKHEHEISKQRTITYAGIVGFVLMLIITAISFRAYRQKRKANKAITYQKHLVEEKQKEILDSIHYAKRIQTAFMTNEKYIERNLNKLNEDK